MLLRNRNLSVAPSPLKKSILAIAICHLGFIDSCCRNRNCWIVSCFQVGMEIEPSLWHACSGLTRMKPLQAPIVYYFPQGHAENCSDSTVQSQTLASELPAVKCRVLAMQLFADNITDEVYAQMTLRPTDEAAQPIERAANMIGYGFIQPLHAVTPHECVLDSPGADRFLPKLNCTLVIRDLHNVEYTFEHQYIGLPRSHILTDGWSTFVNHKRLCPGDSLVFLRTQYGIKLGIRRGEFFAGLGYGRTKSDMLTLSAVAEAVGKALRKMEFQAVVYPQPNSSLFIHDAREVDVSVAENWSPGMLVTKIFVSRELMYKRDLRWGHLRSLTKDLNMWSASSWKQLQVTWGEDGEDSSANPWDLKIVRSTVPVQKRMRLFGFDIEE